MSRYRLLPSPAQEAVRAEHCAHARFVWNLAVEQHAHWHPGRRSAPGYLEQCRQLTAARVSTGELLYAPGMTDRERKRVLHLQRSLAGAKRGSNRRARVKLAIARLRARETDRRRDWAEKASTDITCRFDMIQVEELQIGHMTRSAKGTAGKPGTNVRQKAGLNRQIMRSGWGLLVRRLKDKAPGRVEEIRPAFTSQRCSVCGHEDAESRKSQACFVCTACGLACNADVNAAINIAAGHPTRLPIPLHAREGLRDAGPTNREPQLLLQST